MTTNVKLPVPMTAAICAAWGLPHWWVGRVVNGIRFKTIRLNLSNPGGTP